MPLFDFICFEEHVSEHYVATYKEALEARFLCKDCPPFHTSYMRFLPSCGGRGLLWFEEGRERTIENLGHEPVRITSKKQHRDAMRKAGVAEAGNRRGTPGAWI